MPELDVFDEEVLAAIKNMIELCGGIEDPLEKDLITQQIQTSLKLVKEGHNTAQLKLITRSLKEMRYAYRIFNEYPGAYRISIFGSARTPENHPDYKSAEEFSMQIARAGWMCITGAASGIMKAGLRGSAPESSFGLSIRLPFETSAGTFAEGDPKLIHFRYFFTRKLMFISHADAVAVFPGGFGTLDELFEILTLMQTGKSSVIPIVLVEGEKGVYWRHWEEYVQKNLFGNGWVSPEDKNLYHIASSPKDAVEHIQKFYKRFHSYRYVKDDLVIRIKSPITEDDCRALYEKFPSLVETGAMRIGPAFTEENDYLDMQRLSFHHTRKNLGHLRALIDRINEL